MFFVILNFVIIAIMSYIWGFDICIIVMTLGLAGVIYGVVVLGMLGLLIFASSVIIMSITCKKYIITKNSCDEDSRRGYMWLYFAFIIIAICVLFIMSLLFSSIHIFVIVE